MLLESILYLRATPKPRTRTRRTAVTTTTTCPGMLGLHWTSHSSVLLSILEHSGLGEVPLLTFLSFLSLCEDLVPRPQVWPGGGLHSPAVQVFHWQ